MHLAETQKQVGELKIFVVYKKKGYKYVLIRTFGMRKLEAGQWEVRRLMFLFREHI